MGLGWKHAALRALGHQHYILHGRDGFIRMCQDMENPPSAPFEVPFFGMRYRGDLNTFIDWSVYYYGAFSKNELYLLRDVATSLRKALLRPIYFYDIGANVGQHTLFLAPRVDRVFAFEPFEPVRIKIQDKIDYNHLSNVTVFPFALGDADAELDFHEPNTGNQGTGSFLAGRSTGKVRKLQVCRGDDFFDTHDLPSLDLAKLDVEGFEVRVLRGLKQHIRRDRPVILMELSPETKAEAESEARFREHLYEDAQIFSVGSVSISSSYRLRPFSFESADEILIVPAEKLSSLTDVVR